MSPDPVATSVSPWQRLNGPARIAGVDLARGLAVLGMFTAHLLERPDLVWTDPSTWIAIVDGRSSILFAVLAGVSIGLVTGGRVPFTGDRMGTARQRLAVRAGALWLLGLALIMTRVPVLVILPAYAVLFLLAIPFTAMRARTIMLSAAGVALVMPLVQAVIDADPFWETAEGDFLSRMIGYHYPFTVWMAFVLAGLGLARADIRRMRTQLWMVGGGALLAVGGYGLDAVSVSDSRFGTSSLAAAVWTAEPHSSGLLEVFGSGGFALAVLGASLLLCRTVVTWVVLPLRAVGAMPLTAYTAQLVAWAVWALAALGSTRGLAAFRELEPYWPLTLGIVVGCTAWALTLGRGPLEWLIDGATRLAVPAAEQHPDPSGAGPRG